MISVQFARFSVVVLNANSQLNSRVTKNTGTYGSVLVGSGAHLPSSQFWMILDRFAIQNSMFQIYITWSLTIKNRCNLLITYFEAHFFCSILRTDLCG